jgi:hypothetical protein
VSASGLVGPQAGEDRGEGVRVAGEEGLAASREDDVAAGAFDHLARRLQAAARHRGLEQRLGALA